MTVRVQRGMLDTCTVIDLPTLDPARLPVEVAIPAVVLAELAQGVAMTKSAEQIMIRSQRLADIEAAFAAIPFDREAARRYGTLVALTIAASPVPGSAWPGWTGECEPGQAPQHPDGRGNQPGASRAVGAGTHRPAICRGELPPRSRW